MSVHAYDTATPRIGKVKGKMLKHAVPREVLGITGELHKMDKNMSDTMIFRRFVPFGGAATNSTTINQWDVDENQHLTQEGVTPDADTITPQDITVTLNQYACLYMYTDKTAELYEDNIPDAMKKQAGQRMGLVREKVRYGALKGCTNKFYSGGTSRATVDEVIGLTNLRSVTRTLHANRCDTITEVLAPSRNYNTTAVEASFLVFSHTDTEQDIRDLPGFTNVKDYGSRKTVHAMELGSVENFRFVISPELSPIADAGGAVAGLSIKSTSGTSADVYPIVVVGEDAWADLALRGKDSFDVIHIPHDREDKNDPLKQRGYLGSKFYATSFIQNDGWMAVIEAAVTDL